MKSSKGTNAASLGITFSKGPGGVITWSTSADTNERARRFALLQHQAILAPDTLTGVLVVRLICLDGIHPDALPNIEQSECSTYRVDSRHAIEWKAEKPNRLERRFLSALTVRCWTNQALTGLEQSLVAFLNSSAPYQAITDPVAELKMDFECWLNDVLPASLFAHCCGQSCLSAVNRSTWGRLETRKALEPADATSQKEQEPDVGSTGVLIDAAMDGQGKTISTVLLKTTLDILSEKHASNVDGLTKRHWAIEIGKLSGRVSSSNAKTGVLIAWPVHMCEAGTLAESNPAASTIQTYTRRAMLKLAAAIEQLEDHPEEWHLYKLLAIYEVLLSAEPPSTRGILSSALSNFHHYLTEWFDVAPLDYGLQAGDAADKSVLAEIVWSHEVRWSLETVSKASDPIMGLYAQAMLYIASEQGVRIQDLQRLQLCSIHFGVDREGGFCEVEIARDARRGRIKTTQSQRRLKIRNADAIAYLQKLHTKRHQEGATNVAYLFGDPANDKLVYRAATLHAYINTVLKRATGSSRVRFHTLRHTAISQQVEVAWCSSPLVDVNPLEMIAAVSGHSSPVTTLRLYSHLYEKPIRLWLDLALTDIESLSAIELGAIVNLKPNTLVQAARRKSLTPMTHAWRLLDVAVQNLAIDNAAKPYQWAGPIPPSAGSAIESTLTVTVIERCLQDLIAGVTVHVVAHRLQLDAGKAEAWVSTLKAYMQNRIRQNFPRRSIGLNLGSKSLAELLTLLDCNMASTHQAKYISLSEYLQQPPDSKVLNAAITSWELSSVGNWISLAPPHRARGIFQLFKLAKVNPLYLRPMVQDEAGDVAQPAIGTKSMDRAVKLDVQDVFSQEFDVKPIIEPRGFRLDRPMAYLAWTSDKSLLKTPSAAGEIAGLVSWLICIKAYLLLTEDK